MLIEDLVDGIEYVAPLKNAASWDCSGVQVASSKNDVSKVAVCLDPTPASILAAQKQGAQFILSHHPLSLAPCLPKKLDSYHESLRLLLSCNTWLYAAHTSLDANPEGPAGWLARELGMSGIEVLEVLNQCDGKTFGFGLIGDLPEPIPMDRLEKLLARVLHLTHATMCGYHNSSHDNIVRLAYCTGSGASLADTARQKGAQIYITGDVRYHAALDTQIPILDVGHHSLEEEMMLRFCELLSHKYKEASFFFVPSRSPFFQIAMSS